MPPQQQQGGDENATLWICALSIAALVGIWFFLHAWIAFLFLKLKLLEIDLLSPFTNQLQALKTELQGLTPSMAGDISLNVLAQKGTTVGNILRYPLIAILVILNAFLFFGHVTSRYRSTYTMNRLAEAEEADWPQISPVVPLNLIEVPLDEGPWAMALNPMAFAKKYRLLTIEQHVAGEHELSSNIKHKVSLKRLLAKQVLLMQLGNYWHDVYRLPIHFRALFALFAAKAHNDVNSVIKLNAQIATSATKSDWKNIDYTGIDELLAKYINEKAVQKIVSAHAFVYTVMASMLNLARTSGVYASSDFLWLKPIDRRLWYVLNNVGRKTAFAEVAGIISHWNAELIFRNPIFVPMVDEAIEALDIAISEILYKGEE